jgi:hypothetical protein
VVGGGRGEGERWRGGTCEIIDDDGREAVCLKEPNDLLAAVAEIVAIHGHVDNPKLVDEPDDALHRVESADLCLSDVCGLTAEYGVIAQAW